MVLKTLYSPSFEPLESVDWRELSLKVALFTALVSAKRVSDLCALSVHPPYLCLSFSGSYRDRILRLPQRLSPRPFPHRYWTWWLLSPLLMIMRKMLCFINCAQCVLCRYMCNVHSLFDNQIVCYSAAARGKSVTAQRFSHWLTDAINWAYESMGLSPLTGVHAHSTRGLAASRAVSRGKCAGHLYSVIMELAIRLCRFLSGRHDDTDGRICSLERNVRQYVAAAQTYICDSSMQ